MFWVVRENQNTPLDVEVGRRGTQDSRKPTMMLEPTVLRGRLFAAASTPALFTQRLWPSASAYTGNNVNTAAVGGVLVSRYLRLYFRYRFKPRCLHDMRVESSHHIARGHHLRLDAVVHGGTPRAEVGNRISSGCVGIRVNDLGYGEAGATRGCGSYRENIFGDSRARNCACRAYSIA